ncbi:MAG TPA: hypothetical protein VM077_02735, partial [Candidatus Limnocylindrales bacterium]|nr:hypothetical protein [Candidatus Limnocylindrales bacterium]
MRQIFIFLILFSPILVFAPRSVSAHSTNSLHDEQVILSDRGFEPESLTVSPGTTVTFKIKGDNQHWPASNFHPSHDLYPDSGGCIG